MSDPIKHKQISRVASLWTPPDVAHDYDEEFEGGSSLPSGWVESFTPSGSIDPYTVFNTGSPKREIGTWRSSCYSIQVPNDDAKYYCSRPITVPTNFFIWSRASFSYRYNSSTGNDSNVALALSASDSGQPDEDNMVLMFLNEADAGDVLQMQAQKNTSGTVSVIRETSDRGTTGIGQYYEYVGIQKIGTTYYFWAFSENGQMFYLGTTTFAVTVDRIGFYFQNNNSASPGNSIVTVDFVRCKESSVFLPGYGN